MSDRREFTKPVQREIEARAAGQCECDRMPADIRHAFPKDCQNPPEEIDHVYAEVLNEVKDQDLTAEDGAHLCRPCHVIKSAFDMKAKSIRNKLRVRKDRPKSGWWSNRNYQWPKRSIAKRLDPGKKERRSSLKRWKHPGLARHPKRN